jgi:hypothetical protein
MSNFRGFNLQPVKDATESSHTFTDQDNPHVLSLSHIILLLVIITCILLMTYYMIVGSYRCNKFKRYIIKTKAKQSPYQSPMINSSAPLPLFRNDKYNKRMNMLHTSELYKEKIKYEPLEIDDNYRVSFYAVVEQTPSQYI